MDFLLTNQSENIKRLSDLEESIDRLKQLITQKSPSQYVDYYNDRISEELKFIARTKDLAIKDTRPPNYVNELVKVSEYGLQRIEFELSSYLG